MQVHRFLKIWGVSARAEHSSWGHSDTHSKWCLEISGIHFLPLKIVSFGASGWLALLVKHPALDVSSGLNLTLVSSSPTTGFEKKKKFPLCI